MNPGNLAGAIRHLVLSIDRLATAIDEAADGITESARRRASADGTHLSVAARRADVGGFTNQEVRAWAALEGITVKPTGRIPNAVVAAYVDYLEMEQRAG